MLHEGLGSVAHWKDFPTRLAEETGAGVFVYSRYGHGGSDALEWESERSRHGESARSWLRTKGNSIEGGTSEVQLSVIAKRILELPGA